MELVAEFEPVKSREELEARARLLEGVFDWVDVPDSPMGVPGGFSPIVAMAVKSASRGLRVIAHLRLIDLSRLAVESIIKSIRLTPIERLLFLRGDPPARRSTVVNDVTPEEAVELARRKLPGREFGLLLSLRKPLNDILSRLRRASDFYLVLNASEERLGLLKSVYEEARRLGSRIYVYVMVVTGKNSDIARATRARWFKPPEAVAFATEQLRGLCDGVVVSAPRDFGTLVEVGRAIMRRL